MTGIKDLCKAQYNCFLNKNRRYCVFAELLRYKRKMGSGDNFQNYMSVFITGQECPDNLLSDFIDLLQKN